MQKCANCPVYTSSHKSCNCICEDNLCVGAADPGSFVTHMPVVSLETNHEHIPGRGHVFMCLVTPTNPHAVPLHSNMLMCLCSALIGPSDARPAPPVFTGSLQSVLQPGPRHCVRACSANIMQTNTALLFGTLCTDPPMWEKGRRYVKGKGERNKGGGLEFISVIT